MKKFLSILLALVMVLSLGTAAFAAEDDTTVTLTTVEDNEETDVAENATAFDVKAKTKLVAGDHANITYYVNVEWLVDTATININKGDLYKWDPEELIYKLDENEAAGSTGENKTVGVTITMQNCSNAAVNYTIAYADNKLDKLNTSEAKNTDSAADKTGTLATADTAGVATPDDESGYAYVIDTGKLNTAGAAAAATVYTATVTLDGVENGDDTVNGAQLKLGTYTVTLGEYVEPEPVVETKTIADILPANFPTTVDTGWKDRNSEAKAYKDDTNLYLDERVVPLTTTIAPDGTLGTSYAAQVDVETIYFNISTPEDGVLTDIVAYGCCFLNPAFIH